MTEMNSGAASGPHGSACDACRRRRVRCVGQQPCDGCRRNKIVCTYGDVNARTSAVGYARLLEQRVSELETLLRQTTQNQDDDDLGHQHPSSSSTSNTSHASRDIPSQTLDMVVSDQDVYLYHDHSPTSTSTSTSTSTMYGALSGLNMLRAVVAHAVKSPSQHQQASLGSSGHNVLRAFDKNIPRTTPQQLVGFCLPELPSRAGVEKLVEMGTRLGLIGFYCLDEHDLSARINVVLAKAPLDDAGGGYTAQEIDSLALVYALLALGQRFEPMETSASGNGSRQKGIDYFCASHKLLDTTTPHNLSSIRTTIVQTRYLLSTSMVSQAYLRHQIGVTLAQQMGLAVSRSRFSMEEARQRRIVLATINMQETFFSSIIGIPKTLHIDPQMISGFEDEELRHGSAHPGLAEAVCFQQLGDYMSEILQHRYPSHAAKQENAEEGQEQEQTAAREKHDSASFQAKDVEFVKDVGEKIDQWHSNLPTTAPSTNSTCTSSCSIQDKYTLTAQLSVRLMHAAAQNMLYRPYLHYLARESTHVRFNMDGFEYGSRCVRSAMQAICVIDTLRLHDLLHEAHWFTIYMLVYASIVLIYFVNNAKVRVTLDEAREALAKARRLLGFLALYNGTAERCCRIIATVVGASNMEG